MNLQDQRAALDKITILLAFLLDETRVRGANIDGRTLEQFVEGDLSKRKVVTDSPPCRKRCREAFPTAALDDPACAVLASDLPSRAVCLRAAGGAGESLPDES